jgi:hypothetical protein
VHGAALADDQDTGQRRSRTEILASRLEFLSKTPAAGPADGDRPAMAAMAGGDVDPTTSPSSCSPGGGQDHAAVAPLHLEPLAHRGRGAPLQEESCDRRPTAVRWCSVRLERSEDERRLRRERGDSPAAR